MNRVLLAPAAAANDSGGMSPLSFDFAGYLKSKWDRHLARWAELVDDWTFIFNKLIDWEHEHLLDQPNAQRLAEHRRALEALLEFGRICVLSTRDSNFPAKELAPIVAATMQAMEDHLALWHGPMTEPERAKLLQEIFPE